MRQCPKCTAVYLDETLAFCLEDGTRLTDTRQADTPTAVYAETELVTSVRPGGIAADPRFMESQVTRVGSLATSPPTKSNKSGLMLAFAAMGAVVLCGLAGIIGFTVYKNSGGIVADKGPSGPNVNASAPAIPTPTGKPTSTPTPTATPTSTPSATPASTPKPERASYPSTVRLKFARGAYATSYSGEINPGDTRSVVLACLSGQTLSASISGGESCVSIRGGGSSTRFTTSSGDNYVSVSNSCSTVVRFSISITVL